jgi:hypothetical protein
MSVNILFINEETVKSRTGISNGIDGKQLKPQIKLAQDMYLQPVLGSTLYSRLQSGVAAANLTAAESTLLNNYITDCLVWYTMSLLPMALGYQFFSKGVLQKTADESNTPGRADLELIANTYKSTAEFYKQRIIGYLQQNYTLFSEYYQTGTGWDVIQPVTKAYTCPIYLGGSYVPSENKSFSNNSVSGLSATITYTPTPGVSSFTVTEFTNNTIVVIAVRSGMVKSVTNSATSNTLYLQINGSTVTLPTGDTVADGEVFIFTYR